MVTVRGNVNHQVFHRLEAQNRLQIAQIREHYQAATRCVLQPLGVKLLRRMFNSPVSKHGTLALLLLSGAIETIYVRYGSGGGARSLSELVIYSYFELVCVNEVVDTLDSSRARPMVAVWGDLHSDEVYLSNYPKWLEEKEASPLEILIVKFYNCLLLESPALMRYYCSLNHINHHTNFELIYTIRM